jgi:hypothetical protein
MQALQAVASAAECDDIKLIVISDHDSRGITSTHVLMSRDGGL